MRFYYLNLGKRMMLFLGLLIVCKLWKCFLFVDFRYSDEQIPGVLYASVNPEYMTSTDGM